MEGISNNYIESFLKGRVNSFLGVFSANNLPTSATKKKNFTLICNHENLGEFGSHFITIVGFPNFVYYLDSLGRPCSIASIRRFLQSLERPIFYNSKKLQSPESVFCGFYCILYVLYFDRAFDGITPPKIKFCSNDLLKNDGECIRQIKEYMK